MKKIIFIALSFFVFVPTTWAGFIYQDFEPENGVLAPTWGVGASSVTLVDRTEGVHLGANAIKHNSFSNWGAIGIAPQISFSVDLKQINNDRITFWTLSLPFEGCNLIGCGPKTDNNVGVRFYDDGLYAQSGYEVWTTNNARYGQWTKLWILFSQLPPDFDLTRVTRIEFKNYYPGFFYFDDIHAVREDRVYQSFEKERRSGTMDSDYGWKWNDGDTATLSVEGELVWEGSHSWKLILNGNWGGGGIQSQEKKYVAADPDQTFWNVDLNPGVNDRLTFWIYALPQNGLDNNLSVQFYDNGAHNTDETKAVVWTKEAARYGHWTRLTVLFSDLPKTLNLRDINKIQFQQYWPGTFYFDDIRASAPLCEIKENHLSNGMIRWASVSGAVNYRLQQSVSGPQGPWRTIYSGIENHFRTTRLSTTWFRIRWEEDFKDHYTIPYSSDWSQVVEYRPAAVLLKYKNLRDGFLSWDKIPQTSLYEVQASSNKIGPWVQVYKGSVPSSAIAASVGKWYRIRAIQEDAGAVVDSTAWSRPQKFAALGQGYVRAVSTMLKDQDGSGDELVLTGVNLGNYLLTEDWMTGFGQADNPTIADDWTLRSVLKSRFGEAQTQELLKSFQNEYLQISDFDRLVDMGVTVARLPIYYRNLQDDQGNWILNASGQIDFESIDRVVDALADRGIYTIIDLHGAPGSQSAEFHTGRKNFNRLFNQTAEGANYRVRTVNLWKEIAKHYSDNTWVIGYDLLNEPVGAPTPQILWDLYDQIYKAIRLIDSKHLIMMEGIWDWDTLPIPSTKNWTNVLYQFHYYNFGFDEDFASHKNFIDQKMAENLQKQPIYNVPVMIGEFHGFSLKSIWDYYLQKFNEHKISWVMWSYKMQNSPSNWGLYNHARYDESLPKFRATQLDGSKGDSYTALKRKLLKYRTEDYHVPNHTLIDILKANSMLAVQPTASLPLGDPAPSYQIMYDHTKGIFTLSGKDLGDTPGIFQFYATPCNDYPPGTKACNFGYAGILFWSDTFVRALIPPDVADYSGRFNISAYQGGDLHPTMIGENRAPTLNTIGNKSVQEGKKISFTINAVDPDGDPMVYKAFNLPVGAKLNGKNFSWTPNYRQSGIYNVTFSVSDGQFIDQESVVFEVTNVAVADLFIRSISSLSSTVTAGNNVLVSTSVENKGAASAGASYIRFHLSKDNVYGGSNDIVITPDFSIPAIAAQYQFSNTYGIKVPAQIAKGLYYVCVEADVTRVVTEEYENNQTRCGVYPIKVL